MCFSQQAYRLICNMTYLARHATSLDFDLRLNSDISLLRPICTYFNATRIQEYDAAKIMSLAFLVQKFFAKNVLAKKRYFDHS